jgi:hypothetical protein
MKKRKGNLPKTDKRKGVKRANHNIPDEIDLALWKAEYEKYASKLDENGYRKPITERELVGWIRKKLDDVWRSCPQKLAFLEKMRVPDYDPNTRRTSKWQCNITKEWFNKTDVQVDHIQGEHEFTRLDQLVEFANKRFMVGYNDLQILSIEAHSIKTHAERYGMTYDEAKIDKQAIAIQDTKKDKEWLTERGITPGKNSKIRKQQLIDRLREEKNNDRE